MTNPTVMVIDTDVRSAELAAGMARANGLEPDYVGRHGIDALQAAARLKPDILFVAVEDPLARSMQTLEFVRELHPGCAVIAYSSDDSPEVARRVMRSAAVDLLRAPLNRKDVGLALHRATQMLERQAEATEIRDEGRGGVFAVVGQKGGIGKTTIATNLASALASRTGESVLIIDLDTRFGDVALAMNTESTFTAASAARGLGNLDRDSFRSLLEQHACGAFVLPAPEHPREWVDVTPGDVRALITFASEIFDYVILDTPGTLDEMVAVAIEASSRVIAVTSLDLTSIKNTNLLLAYLEGHGIDRQDVVLTVSHNLEHNITSAQDVSNLLEKVVDFEVPYSRATAKASTLGTPIVVSDPTSVPAHAYAGLASLVTGTTIAMPVAAARRGLLGRFFGPRTDARPIVPTVRTDDPALAGAR